jgi:hypothetical protein
MSWCSVPGSSPEVASSRKKSPGRAHLPALGQAERLQFLGDGLFAFGGADIRG